MDKKTVRYFLKLKENYDYIWQIFIDNYDETLEGCYFDINEKYLPVPGMIDDLFIKFMNDDSVIVDMHEDYYHFETSMINIYNHINKEQGKRR